MKTKTKGIIISIMLALALCIPVVEPGMVSQVTSVSQAETTYYTPAQTNALMKKVCRRGQTKKKIKKIIGRGLGSVVREADWDVGHMKEYAVTLYYMYENNEKVYFTEWHLMFVKNKLEDWNIVSGKIIDGEKVYN